MTGGCPLFLPACSTHTHTHFCVFYGLIFAPVILFDWNAHSVSMATQTHQQRSLTGVQLHGKTEQGKGRTGTQAIDFGAREHSVRCVFRQVLTKYFRSQKQM